MSAAAARWDGFLAQIEQRHAQVRGEAEAHGRAFDSADSTPLSHHLMGVRSRLQDLEGNITSTWHAKVDDVYAAEGASPETRAAAYAKGDALKHALDDAREELEIQILADLARRRPDAAVALAPHVLSQEAATAEWRAMRAAERALHAIRPPREVGPVKAWELAQIAYWRAYLTVRGVRAGNPDPQPRDGNRRAHGAVVRLDRRVRTRVGRSGSSTRAALTSGMLRRLDQPNPTGNGVARPRDGTPSNGSA